MEISHIFDNSITNDSTSFSYEGTWSPEPSYEQVDLTGFKEPAAKIDCLTFDFPLNDKTVALIAEYQAKLTTGRLQHPEDYRSVINTGRMWLTLHDPSTPDLRRLIAFFPMARITYIVRAEQP